MPRRSKTAIEEGYLRSFWEEVSEVERERNAVVTITMYATTSRGVFTVEMRALEMMIIKDNAPVTHSITKRLPDGGNLPFVGAMWDCARKLNDMVSQAAMLREAQAGRQA